jgi:hypothetical protein
MRGEAMAPFSFWHGLTMASIVFAALVFAVPMAVIIRRLGFSWPVAVIWALLAVTPGVGLAAIWVLALVEWPHWRHAPGEAAA